MNKKLISFFLNDKKVQAKENESIWQVAKRFGEEIPHLCYSDEKSFRADGNCRACMVEIEGERVLAASCIRQPIENMKVFTASEKAKKSRKLVFELLLTDQPKKEEAHDPNSQFWNWIEEVEVKDSRFPKKMHVSQMYPIHLWQLILMPVFNVICVFVLAVKFK